MTLKTMVAAEVELGVGPAFRTLQLVKIADGCAQDDWTFLSRVLHRGGRAHRLLPRRRASRGGLRCGLWSRRPQGDGAVREVPSSERRHETDGVEKVIRAATPSVLEASRVRTSRTSARLLPQQPPPHGLRRAEGAGLAYRAPGWSRRRARPWSLSGSSVRGMRWSERGGQAILTLRSLLQSNRFDSGWSLLLQTYRADVSAPDNVVPLRQPRIH